MNASLFLFEAQQGFSNLQAKSKRFSLTDQGFVV